LYATAPEQADSNRCPYLDESLAQFCGAAPVAKFIPFSEALLSRCGSSAFRYCDLFITMAHPQDRVTQAGDGIATPEWLLYAGNHMWLDAASDGVCHIGVDALLARVLGRVDRITYLTTRGMTHPAVVLSTGAADLHMTFPNRLLVTGCNLYLRANPAKLVADPYRLGWLFECRPPDEGVEFTRGLIGGGPEAARWMQSEYDRIGSFVHRLSQASCEGNVLMADGGDMAPGLIEHLDRTQIARLYHDFFSPESTR
jgi:glycine cleavage system H lipoate-binding protein